MSTMTFSPDGIASRYRLCATTTFTPANATFELVPELPEVEALAAYVRERAVGHTVQRLEVPSFSALKTFEGEIAHHGAGRCTAVHAPSMPLPTARRVAA